MKKENLRLTICNNCEFKKVLLGNLTCGTAIVGETVTYNNKRYKLCGCIMKVKTLIPTANCPLKKW
jgi:hypothetical protein